MTSSGVDDHAIAMADGRWSVWQDALLRSAGFPADGLTLFSMPECAAAADDYLAGKTRREEFDDAFARASAGCSARICKLASDPLLSAAITWQSLSALIAVDKLVTAGPEPRRNRKHRARERLLIRYWQRSNYLLASSGLLKERPPGVMTGFGSQ